MTAAVGREGRQHGSRLLRGEATASRRSRAVAAFKGTETLVYFSSGYLANTP